MERLSVGDVILSFCVPCGDVLPVAMTVRKVELRPVERADPRGPAFVEVLVNNQEQDLAYTYVRRGATTWENLGHVLHCTPDLASSTRAITFDQPRRDATTERPPARFVRPCPWPCPDWACPEGEWTTARAAALLRAPNTVAPKVAEIQPGERVTPLACEEHVDPARGRVVFLNGQYEPGDVVYLLSLLDEGRVKTWDVWHHGSIQAIDSGVGDATECAVPSRRCWLVAEGEPRTERWVKVRRADGTAGWLNDAPVRFEHAPPPPD